MPVEINAIANCDDAVVFWKVKQPIPDCWGYAVEREQQLADGTVQSRFLENRMGFEADDPQPGDTRPSTEWPFQRFSWTDHSVNEKDVVRYRVVPIVHDGTQLVQLTSERSKFTDWLELSAQASGPFSVFFNRGLIISQFMSRYLEELRVKQGLSSLRAAAKLFKQQLSSHELPIRRFLSGALRLEMLRLLDDVKAKKGHVFAALYELSDAELIDQLGKLGTRGHIVLANGSITAEKGEPAAEARKRDQNKAARATLRKKKLEVLKRFTSPGRLGHNKFLVFTDSKQKPLAVWTGSTNWSTTGLCTQINNGLYVKNAALAKLFFEHWQRLKAARSEFPASLMQENSKPKKLQIGGGSCITWFTPTSKQVDLKELKEVVDDAEDAVLFLMFQPGNKGTLPAIKALLQGKKGSKLYIKGVVSTLQTAAAKPKDGDRVSVKVVGDGKAAKPVGLDIVQPQGIRSFASWASTITRSDFIPKSGVIGYAIVHSKLIVVDPFTKPVVITGSHNFSESASKGNDENFLIIRDQPELAKEYAAHILSVYHHYRWLQLVNDVQRRNQTLKGYLREHDEWQARHLKGPSRRELDFWIP